MAQRRPRTGRPAAKATRSVRARRATPLVVLYTSLLFTTVVTANACGARSELNVPDPCAGKASVFVTLTPLDVVVMMDNSGSMDYLTPSGNTRKSAVDSAFEAFFLRPEAEGVSVSLNYFPILNDAVALACVNDDDCGQIDACQPARYCQPSGGGACRTNSDCSAAGFPGDICEQIGFCDDLVTQCLVGRGGCPGSECMEFNHCDNRWTCDADTYGQAWVPMAPLPEAGGEFLAELKALEPLGGTPTLPALRGAVEQARRGTANSPERDTIVVLATDGLPTACDPEIQSGDPERAVDNLIAVTAAGLADGVRTFVIGLSTPVTGNTSATLNAVALAGGTSQALIAGADIVSELVDALATVRLTAGACTFSLGPGATNDRSARVRLTMPDGSRPYAPWRADAGQCGSDDGFFFVPTQSPNRVVLCPASCRRFGSLFAREIEVFTECPL